MKERVGIEGTVLPTRIDEAVVDVAEILPASTLKNAPYAPYARAHRILPHRHWVLRKHMIPHA